MSKVADMFRRPLVLIETPDNLKVLHGLLRVPLIANDS